MNKKITYSFIFLVFAIFSFSNLANSGGRANVANSGNTGAPGESGTTCASCHTGGAFGSIAGTVSFFELGTNNIISNYVPGITYDVEVAITTTAGSPIGYGFQMTFLGADNLSAGTFQNLPAGVGQSTIVVAGNPRTYVEQEATINMATIKMEWVAPTTGTGDLTLYYVVNAVNANGQTGGDMGTSGSTLSLAELACSIAIAGNVTSESAQGAADGAIDATVTTSSPPLSYLWSNGQTIEDISGLTADSYTLTATDGSGCQAIEKFDIETITAVKSINGLVDLDIFPNPTKDFIQLNLSLESQQDIQLSLMDLSGRLLVDEFVGTTNVASINFDVSAYAAGLYLVRIVADGEVLTRKVVVE